MSTVSLDSDFGLDLMASALNFGLVRSFPSRLVDEDDEDERLGEAEVVSSR